MNGSSGPKEFIELIKQTKGVEYFCKYDRMRSTAQY